MAAGPAGTNIKTTHCQKVVDSGIRRIIVLRNNNGQKQANQAQKALPAKLQTFSIFVYKHRATDVLAADWLT